MRGKATCHGAATIVNAIATGRGAAFGIDLTTTAEVELCPGPIRVTMDVDESPDLVVECVSSILGRYSEEPMGARVVTRSDIPVSRGLKSSSAAANAVVLATLRALSVQVDPLEAIRIGTRAARKVGVSITGAFDDACASYFGGVVLTDNREERLIGRDRLPDGLKVLLHIPDRKIRKRGLPLERIRSLRGMLDRAFIMAEEGDYCNAMILNGLCHSAALGLDASVAVTAMVNGALAAGLSGTGPATAVLVKEEDVDRVSTALGEVTVVSPFNGGVG